MPSVKELYEMLDRKIPKSLSCSWDNDGLMAAKDCNAPVTRILCALDVTERVLEEANELGCSCIITHHPLIFQPLSALTADSAAGKRLLSILADGITVMSFHTRLDAVEGGVNDTICKTLHIPVRGTFGADGEAIGRIAELDTAMPFASFCSLVKSGLHTPVLHCVSAKRPVQRIAVLGGDGKSDWTAALAAGADTYLTGTMSYNTLLDAKSSGLNVIAAGHYYTEVPVIETLAAWIREAFPDTEVFCAETPCEILTV